MNFIYLERPCIFYMITPALEDVWDWARFVSASRANLNIIIIFTEFERKNISIFIEKAEKLRVQKINKNRKFSLQMLSPFEVSFSLLLIRDVFLWVSKGIAFAIDRRCQSSCTSMYPSGLKTSMHYIHHTYDVCSTWTYPCPVESNNWNHFNSCFGNVTLQS